ncbi:cysteine desulfurase family protein [Kribbella catacumbae]|uniref:cysteine desulfurase family protein n=1 Tax=Kribbella catacumbae TaxID=460086 RepID=UPI00037898D9|nr:cysteine desulfurase family protein [Kribbella catacumbae]
MAVVDLEQQSALYFDYQATTPVDAGVLNAMLPYFSDHFGNAGSRHVHGRTAAAAVETARHQVGALIGAALPGEIAFTSGATESNALVLRTLFSGPMPAHLIISAIEHPSILNLAAELERSGHDVTRLPVDSTGLVDPSAVAAAITTRTRLVSVMHANNEIGTVQPIGEIGRICRVRGVLLHSDMTQSAGSLPVDVEALCVDLASLSAHKFYGPKGVGALYVRQSSSLRNGPGSGESGLRPGTVNVPGIVGLGTAAELARARRSTDAVQVAALRDRFVSEVRTALPDSIVNGHPSLRLPGNLSITFPGVEVDEILRADPELGLAMGSACTSGRSEPSHVLIAIGLSRTQSRSTMRIGFGRETSWDDCRRCLDRLIPLVERGQRKAVGQHRFGPLRGTE